MFLLIFCLSLLKYTYHYNYTSHISLQVAKLAKSAGGQILIFPTVSPYISHHTYRHTYLTIQYITIHISPYNTSPYNTSPYISHHTIHHHTIHHHTYHHTIHHHTYHHTYHHTR